MSTNGLHMNELPFPLYVGTRHACEQSTREMWREHSPQRRICLLPLLCPPGPPPPLPTRMLDPNKTVTKQRANENVTDGTGILLCGGVLSWRCAALILCPTLSSSGTPDVPSCLRISKEQKCICPDLIVPSLPPPTAPILQVGPGFPFFLSP